MAIDAKYVCKKCEEEKSRDHYYKEDKNANGLKLFCKDCYKERSQNHYMNNRSQINEHRKNHRKENNLLINESERYYRRGYRYKNRERIRKYQSDWSKANRLKVREASIKYANKYPERVIANSRLSDAVRYGKIKKPSSCSRCNKKSHKRHIHGHHSDYSKPLDIVWLCVPCHAIEHRR